MSRRTKRKKKAPAYDAAGQARRMARAVLGTPPAARIVPAKKRRPPKHKKREFERESDA